MNLYSQDDFPDIDMALTFHLGLTLRIMHNARTEADDEGAQDGEGAPVG